MKATLKPASPKHEKMNAFAGEWKTTGKVYAAAGTPELPINATDTYEWLEGGFFLVHRWDAQIGGKRHTGMEIMSYDAETDIYPMHSYNDEGTRGKMIARVDAKGVWVFGDVKERSTVTFSADGNTMFGAWELKDESGLWKPWMEVRLEK